MFVIAKQAEQVFSEFKEIAQFQLIVSSSGERDELVAKIELADASVDGVRLSVLLSERFPQVCRVKLDRIEYVPKGTIPQERRTIVDQRRWG